ncbi:hypothetical protein BpHYR1_033102, partial [Brachionus plicatilis]
FNVLQKKFENLKFKHKASSLYTLTAKLCACNVDYQFKPKKILDFLKFGQTSYPQSFFDALDVDLSESNFCLDFNNYQKIVKPRNKFGEDVCFAFVKLSKKKTKSSQSLDESLSGVSEDEGEDEVYSGEEN